MNSVSFSRCTQHGHTQHAGKERQRISSCCWSCYCRHLLSKDCCLQLVLPCFTEMCVQVDIFTVQADLWNRTITSCPHQIMIAIHDAVLRVQQALCVMFQNAPSSALLFRTRSWRAPMIKSMFWYKQKTSEKTISKQTANDPNEITHPLANNHSIMRPNTGKHARPKVMRNVVGTYVKNYIVPVPWESIWKHPNHSESIHLVMLMTLLFHFAQSLWGFLWLSIDLNDDITYLSSDEHGSSGRSSESKLPTRQPIKAASSRGKEGNT